MNDLQRKLGYVGVFFALWTILALVFVSLSSASAIAGGNQPNLRLLFVIQFTRFYLWAALSPLIYRVVRRFPIEIGSGRLTHHLLVHLAALVGFCTIHQFFYMVVTWLTDGPPNAPASTFFDNFFGKFFTGVYLGVMIYGLIVFAIQAFIFYRNYRGEEERRLQLTAQLAQAELHALKMQIHPHFLFNTLHSISSLVLEDPPKANQMIARLGDFLRLTLEHSERQVVTLKEEIEFTRCYLDIEQERFSDRLKVEFELAPESLVAGVPHLILLPIVENAVQHAIAPRADGGSIKINVKLSDNSVRIQIADSGRGTKQTKGNTAHGHGVGLANVRGRLKQLYGSNYDFEQKNNRSGGFTVFLEFPFTPVSEGRPR